VSVSAVLSGARSDKLFSGSCIWCSSGLFLAPFLFAIYLDDLSEICTPNCGQFIILYADDILLMTYSVVDLEKLIHLCERELNWSDMTINVKNHAAYVLDRAVTYLTVRTILL